MKRPQFTFRSLLMAMLVVAAFFAGVRFERERRRREDDRRYELDLSEGQFGFFNDVEGPLKPDELRALLSNPER